MAFDVSYIIAAYNAEDTIAAAIESALGQTGVSVEVIVADDRSTDRTAEIARSFSERPVRVVTLERNLGPGGARNRALEVARGRWVAVLDADDRLTPERTARMIARGEARGAAAVVDNLRIVGGAGDENRTMFDPAMLEAIPEISLARLIDSNRIFVKTFNFGYMKPIFRRAFIAEHGLRYDEGLRIGEDYLFLASVLARGGLCAVEPTAGYIYFVREGSISRVLFAHHVTAMLEGDRRFLRQFELDAAARAAQDRRIRNLEQVEAFLRLVDHIKRREIGSILSVALRHPASLRYLSRPADVRLKRLARRLFGGPANEFSPVAGRGPGVPS